ncbi:hypothetical protein P8625_01110 [Tenacibaculum tangerinum]|uniref:Lipocalin-like domain-containing protein n=1 Tax=Tenacibaculum tangerinum TaxID=3038772 RepID=A0ABY8L2X0_9FLAO|nr:hypothetical protein [Tenacibaculum tangerinum]WGH75791.1 hypothetical protein P8625_01110 [Tenacibaculum tangerinum]
MKKVIVLLAFFIGTISIAFSQTNHELNALISGKWNVKSMDFGNEKLEFTEGSSWLEFNADGHYFVMIDETQKDGTWRLIGEKKELEFDEKSFEKNLKIERITKNELLVSATTEKNTYTMLLKR